MANNQQTNGQKVGSQTLAGALSAVITFNLVPPDQQAVAGPALLVVFSTLGKSIRNGLADSPAAKWLP